MSVLISNPLQVFLQHSLNTALELPIPLPAPSGPIINYERKKIGYLLRFGENPGENLDDLLMQTVYVNYDTHFQTFKFTSSNYKSTLHNQTNLKQTIFQGYQATADFGLALVSTSIANHLFTQSTNIKISASIIRPGDLTFSYGSGYNNTKTYSTLKIEYDSYRNIGPGSTIGSPRFTLLNHCPPNWPDWLEVLVNSIFSTQVGISTAKLPSRSWAIAEQELDKWGSQYDLSLIHI